MGGDPRVRRGGEHVLTIGREGEGPGEFQSLSGAWPRSGGNIGGWMAGADHGIRAGGRNRPGVEDRGRGGPDILQVLGSGGTGVDPEFNHDARREGLVARRGESFQHGVSAAQAGWVDHRNRGTTPRGSSGGPEVGRRRAAHAGPVHNGVGGTGYAAGVAATTGETYEVRLFEAGGKLSRIVRLSETPPAWREEDLKAWVPNERLVALAEDFPLPATLPGYGKLAGADTGEIWAQRYLLPGGSMARWESFPTRT